MNKGRAAFDQLEADDSSFLRGKKSIEMINVVILSVAGGKH